MQAYHAYVCYVAAIETHYYAVLCMFHFLSYFLSSNTGMIVLFHHPHKTKQDYCINGSWRSHDDDINIPNKATIAMLHFIH